MTALRLGVNLFIKKITDLNQAESSTWDRLQATEHDLNRAFLSRTYISQVALGNPDVRIVLIYQNGLPAFFLPLQPRRGFTSRFGVFEPVGDVFTDYFGAVAEPHVKLSTQQLLGATEGKINAVLFTHLDETQARFGLHAEERRIGLRTHLYAPFLDYWANLRRVNAKVVSDTDRRERRLQNDIGPISFEWQSSTPDSDLDWLIESKRAQYSRTGKVHAALFDTSYVELLRRLLYVRDPHCSGVLSVLRSDQSIIAAHFGLKCRGVLHIWFPAYDKGFSRYSPGRILLKHMFGAAAGEGVDLFDRGEGDSQAKRDFSNAEHYYFNGIWLAPGLRGLVAHSAISLSWRLRKN